MALELLDNEQMGRADRAAIAAGVAGLDLMEAAGRAVAERAAVLLAAGRRVAIACGPGNNGGDGFVAARILAAQGREVRVGLLGHASDLTGDARAMAQRWQGVTVSLSAGFFEGADLIIDALFGAGLSRPLEGVAADAVAAINAQGAKGIPILAIDVPSGLSGTTGEASGPVVTACETVTFFRLKPGHLLLPGRRLCGRVHLAALPIPESVLSEIAPTAFRNEPDLWRADLPDLALDTHKYVRGHAVVVSGAADATGAARLGARAALRAGAGLVTLVGNPAATAINAVHATAIMVHAVPSAEALGEFLEDRRRNSVLIGPGAGASAQTAQAVQAILASPAAVVLDADALTAFAASASGTDGSAPGGFGFVARQSAIPPTPEVMFGLIKARTSPVLMTPHEGEFKRLFAGHSGNKLVRARQAAAESGAVMVLKGPDTVVAAPDGRAAINANAPPWLATAGSGDVLAGIVSGLLAQGMPAFEAACAAVWMHGAAAQRVGRGLIAEDLPEALPAVLQALFGERDDQFT